MQTEAFTLIEGERTAAVDAVRAGDRILLERDSLARGLGWQLRPEGLCRDARCVPVRDPQALASEAGVDLAKLAEVLDQPLAVDAEERVAVLAASAAERGAQLASGLAPDFTLPDLDGRPHSLAQQRGRKVLLVAYASW